VLAAFALSREDGAAEERPGGADPAS